MEGLGSFITFLFVCTILFFVGGAFGLWAYVFGVKTIESKHPITPEVIIKTESIDGKIKSDTTYIYHDNP